MGAIKPRSSHKDFLERAALREAQKAFRHEAARPSIADFLALRIQTVEPWKRLACVIVGLGWCAFALWLSLDRNGSPWAALLLGMLGLFCLVVGVLGWKRPVEEVLDATAQALFNRLTDLL